MLVPFVAGCGESGGPDPQVERAQVNKEIEMRKLFDKSGGDYSKLDANDKVAMDKLAGGQAGAEAVFADMKKGPGSVSGPPSAPSAPTAPTSNQ